MLAAFDEGATGVHGATKITADWTTLALSASAKAQLATSITASLATDPSAAPLQTLQILVAAPILSSC